MTIILTDTPTSTTETLVGGYDRTPGQAQGPVGELKFSGSHNHQENRKARAANGVPVARGGHIGRLSFSAERSYATRTEADAWVASYMASHLTGDSLAITYDDGVVLTLSDVALVDYDLVQIGLAVMCTHTFVFGSAEDTTPEPEPEPEE